MALIRETGQVQGDRVPPQSAELEMCVLGAVMLEPREAYYIAAEHLTRGSFYLDGHGLIFELMGELIAQGKPPDSVLVLDELRNRQLLDKVGGSGVIMAMLNSVPTAANVEYHSRKVAEKARLRGFIRACTEGIEAAYDQDQPIDIILDSHSQRLQEISAHATDDDPIPISASLQQYWEKLDERELKFRALKAQGIDKAPLTGTPTGYFGIDDRTGGLGNGWLCYVLGAPKMGKTSLVQSMAFNFAAQGFPVLMFSLEMTHEMLTERMLVQQSMNVTDAGRTQYVDGDKLKTLDLSEHDWHLLTRGYERVMEAPIFWDDRGGLTLGRLRRTVRKFLRKHPKGVIIIDGLWLMQPENRNTSRYQQVTDLSNGVKQIALSMRRPFIVTHQFSREGYKHGTRPTPADARDSGSIEQDADVMLYIHRDDYFKPQDRPTGGNSDSMLLPVAEIGVMLNRHGSAGTQRIWWIPEIARYVCPPRGVMD